MVDAEFMLAGGEWHDGVKYSERAFLDVYTHIDLAEALYYLINRFTSFYCVVNHKASCLRANDSIPVTYAIRIDKPPGNPAPLNAFLPMATFSGPTRSPPDFADFGLEVDAKLKPNIVSMSLIDLRHGFKARSKDGLFRVALKWMRRAQTLMTGGIKSEAISQSKFKVWRKKRIS